MHSLVKNGKALLSGVDPVSRADKTVNAFSLKDRTLYLCPSPLYGFGLARLLSRLETEAPNSAVLCIEADPELFDLAMGNIDPLVLKNSKLHITNICDCEKLYSVICSLWGAMTFRRIENIRLNGGWQLFAELYDSVCAQLRREIALQWSNALTLSKLGRLYIRNLLRNLSLITRFQSIENLSFGSSSVLVLGAGPSLDETLDQIIVDGSLGHGRRFKIVCVDTCLGALKDREIVPDLVVILESQHWNLRDFVGCYGWEVSAAIDLSSAPASAFILKGEGFLFMTPWTNLRLFERLKNSGLLPAVVPPLGSVGLTAVELTRRLTSGKIICAGLDFSFSPDKYHARSTPGHRGKLNSQDRVRGILNTAAYGGYSASAVSKEGGIIYTSPSLENYRDLFQQEFSGDSRIFDIEGSGLPLGVKTLSLKEAASLLKKEELKREPTDNRTFGSNTNQCYDKGKQDSAVRGKNNELNLFFESEKRRLLELRGILTGDKEVNKEHLGLLLEECDYLWGHFPDYSGGRSPDASDISFLKRVRAEIDPMLKLIENGIHETQIKNKT